MATVGVKGLNTDICKLSKQADTIQKDFNSFSRKWYRANNWKFSKNCD